MVNVNLTIQERVGKSSFICRKIAALMLRNTSPLKVPRSYKKVIEKEEGVKKIAVSPNLNSSDFYPVYSLLQNVLKYQ